jgi:hypothetical protein
MFNVCQTGRNIIPMLLVLSWLPVTTAYSVPSFEDLSKWLFLMGLF